MLCGENLNPNAQDLLLFRPVVSHALNMLLILHADHEQNCSTSTVRMVGSSEANLYASIAAGICALWGPRHGGANQEVINMLDVIHRDGGDVKKYVDLARDKTSGFRVYRASSLAQLHFRSKVFAFLPEILIQASSKERGAPIISNAAITVRS